MSIVTCLNAGSSLELLLLLSGSHNAKDWIISREIKFLSETEIFSRNRKRHGKQLEKVDDTVRTELKDSEIGRNTNPLKPGA